MTKQLRESPGRGQVATLRVTYDGFHEQFRLADIHLDGLPVALHPMRKQFPVLSDEYLEEVPALLRDYADTIADLQEQSPAELVLVKGKGLAQYQLVAGAYMFMLACALRFPHVRVRLLPKDTDLAAQAVRDGIVEPLIRARASEHRPLMRAFDNIARDRRLRCKMSHKRFCRLLGRHERTFRNVVRPPIRPRFDAKQDRQAENKALPLSATRATAIGDERGNQPAKKHEPAEKSRRKQRRAGDISREQVPLPGF